MYTQFYGLREKPFSLSPDPRYLYLADSHREALAHLLYGIEQGEGFIAITGEVGTGKTTLCRTLLQRIDPGTEIAFIFNPQLSAVELLQAISAELGLESVERSRRELTEQLNRFLLATKAEGRRVLLIIDEAQNLAPETLEQVRLLSNLETDTAKLVQIILIGQPELDAMLESPSLRQLRQRISVRWRLSPLSTTETRDYVRHRMRIAAGAPREIFTELALREVHRRAKGIPRVVNLLCDRALLAGYAAGAASIGLGIVTQTDREIRAGGGGLARTLESSRLERAAPLLRVAVPALGLLALGAAGTFAWQAWRERVLADPPAVATQPPPTIVRPLAPEPRPAAALKPSAPAPAASPARVVAAGPDPIAAAAPASAAPASAAPASAAPASTASQAPKPAAVAPVVASAAARPPARLAPAPRPAPQAEAPEPAAVPVAPAAARPIVARAAPVPPAPVAPAVAGTDEAAALARALTEVEPEALAARAANAALAIWGGEGTGFGRLAPDQLLATLAAQGVAAVPLRNARVATLRFFDRPALLELRADDGEMRLALLEAINGRAARLAGVAPGASLEVSLDALAERWTGAGHVLWRDFEGLPRLLREGQRGAPVAWLQHSLGRLGFYDRAPTGEYDDPTVAAVQAFQASRSLYIDGAVGPVTKMALYEALGGYAIPRLSARGGRG